MKPIKQDEIFQNLSEFLKTRGVELKPGSYTGRIRTGCNLLGDAINLTQEGLERAKIGIDRKLDEMRQVIHAKTAPKPAPSSASGKSHRSAKASKAGSRRPQRGGKSAARKARRG